MSETNGLVPPAPLDVVRDGFWQRLTPPRPEKPHWHDEQGTRLLFTEVLQGQEAEMVERLWEVHGAAVAHLVAAAGVATEFAERRRLATVAGRLCQEAAGLWPRSTWRPGA